MTEITHDIQKHREEDETTIFGFWIYLMTDLVMFAVLFSVYAVLHKSTAGGPTAQELFQLPFVLIETLILLTSSFTIGLSILAVKTQKIRNVVTWLTITTLLGASFLAMEVYEFAHLLEEGASFTRSAFLSAYFALIGTHGLHIAVGILWAIVLIVVIIKKGLSHSNIRKLTLLSLFWHFLDIVWIFIFSIVYLMSSLQ
jgi:cytochrome o ubiquinol oxidase subunit 3